MTDTKVLIVGLDGGTFKNLKPWLIEGQLPFLSKLYSEGAHGVLKAFFPTLSPLEWACFYTGKSPGKLGLFALSHVEDLKDPLSTMHFIDSTTVNAKSLWKYLGEQGIRVGVVNIPATYPPEKVEGFLISGYLTPLTATDYYYPESISQHLDGYKIEVEIDTKDSIDVGSLPQELASIAKRRNEAMISILRSDEIRFLAVNYKEVDTLQHVFWNDDAKILEFMKYTDMLVKDLANEFHPSHIIVMSDHGFHEVESEYFYLNTWLRKRGFLKAAGGFRGSFWRGAYQLGISLSKRSKFIRALVVSRKGSASKYAGLQIDLEKSKMYASQWGIFFSQSARQSADYDEARDKIRQELLSMTSPSGYKVFDKVYLREELFEGEFLDKFPDIIPIPSPRFLINPNIFDKLFDARIDRPHLKGAHKSDPDGILIMSGEGVNAGVDIGTASLIDIVPTVFSLYGFKPPVEMEGKVIENAFSKEFLSKLLTTQRELSSSGLPQEERARKAYSDEEQEQITEQLRRLGYV